MISAGDHVAVILYCKGVVFVKYSLALFWCKNNAHQQIHVLNLSDKINAPPISFLGCGFFWVLFVSVFLFTKFEASSNHSD